MELESKIPMHDKPKLERSRAEILNLTGNEKNKKERNE